MKALDFRKVDLHEALQVRLGEAGKLLAQIDKATDTLAFTLNRDISKGTGELDWADLGSLAHAVEQLEEAAMALGVEVENYNG